MVHTDGINTIANTPRVLDVPLSENEALLEREYSGVRVTLHYFANHPVLRVHDAEGEHSVIVPRDKAIDAFNHPYVYLAR